MSKINLLALFNSNRSLVKINYKSRYSKVNVKHYFYSTGTKNVRKMRHHPNPKLKLIFFSCNKQILIIYRIDSTWFLQWHFCHHFMRRLYFKTNSLSLNKLIHFWTAKEKLLFRYFFKKTYVANVKDGMFFEVPKELSLHKITEHSDL